MRFSRQSPPPPAKKGSRPGADLESPEKDLKDRIAACNDKATLVDLVREIGRLRRKSERTSMALFRHCRRKASQFQQREADDVFEEIAACLKPSEVDHALLKRARRGGRLSRLASFRGSMALRTRQRWLVGKSGNHEWQLDNKRGAFEFMDLLNIRRPDVSPSPSRLAELNVEAGVVVKPASGQLSRGVYLVFEKHRIHDVFGRRMLGSVDEMRQSMLDDLKDGRVQRIAGISKS